MLQIILYHEANITFISCHFRFQAYAVSYPYLTFETTDGAKASFPAEGLEISISGDVLTVKDAAYQISNLSKMYFSESDITSGVAANFATEVTEGSEIYAMSGNRVRKEQMHTSQTREILARIQGDKYFTFEGIVTESRADDMLRRGEADVILYLRDDQGTRHTHIASDASNPPIGQSFAAYLQGVINDGATAPAITHTMYNPQLKSAYNFVPGILGMIFILVCAIIMIFQLMGGLFTPIGSMPEWAQAVTYAIPPRYFNEIIRAIYLKGAGIGDLQLQYAALAGIALLVCSAAALSYRKRI